MKILFTFALGFGFTSSLAIRIPLPKLLGLLLSSTLFGDLVLDYEGKKKNLNCQGILMKLLIIGVHRPLSREKVRRQTYAVWYEGTPH